MLVGANFAVTPFGSPLTDSVIADLNPSIAAVEMIRALELPAATVALVALLESVNVGTATVIVTFAVRVKPPPVPLMMTVELFAAALLVAENVTVTGVFPLIVAAENFTVTPAWCSARAQGHCRSKSALPRQRHRRSRRSARRQQNAGHTRTQREV